MLVVGVTGSAGSGAGDDEPGEGVPVGCSGELDEEVDRVGALLWG